MGDRPIARPLTYTGQLEHTKIAIYVQPLMRFEPAVQLFDADEYITRLKLHG
jgi:hypothetical protein